MARSFQEVAMQVKQRCPLADVMLCRDWVQTAYNKVADWKHFSWLRSFGEILITAARTGVCEVTQGSTQVVPGTLTFSAADIGRQFRVGSTGLPITVVALSGANALLESPYQGTTSTTASAQILDAFVTMPEDFGHFIPGTVVDLTSQRRLCTWISDAELSIRDPARNSVAAAEPVALVTRKVVSQIAARRGRIEYELWPYVTLERRIQYYYIQRPAQLTDDDTFLGPLRERTDILVTGALAECALWPGPDDSKKNPYFKLELQGRLRREFEEQLETLTSRDEEVFLTWWNTMGFDSTPWAPLDADWLQSHAALPVGAYYN